MDSVYVRVVYGRVVYGRFVYGRVVYGRVVYVRVVYGRVVYGRVVYGRVVYDFRKRPWNMPGNRIRMQPYTIAAVYGPPYTIAAVYDRSRIWFQVSTSAAYTLVFAHNFPHNDPPSYPHNFPHINFYNAPKSTLALARSGNFKLFPCSTVSAWIFHKFQPLRWKNASYVE